jgi:hypothetical protein
MTTRIGCTVEVVIEHGVIVGINTKHGYHHEDDITIERGPPNLELQLSPGEGIKQLFTRSPPVQIFERIVSAMTREFPQDDKRTVL